MMAGFRVVHFCEKKLTTIILARIVTSQSLGFPFQLLLRGEQFEWPSRRVLLVKTSLDMVTGRHSLG